MNSCVVCAGPILNAVRATKKYCSEHCRYRVQANRAGRKPHVPAAQRSATSYAMVHRLLQTVRGSASAHACVNCGGQARQWAYDHKDPNGRVDPTNGLTFSSDIGRYAPMCSPCHRDFDNAATDRQAKCGTAAGYDRHRRVTKTPACQACKDALAARARAYTAITDYEEQPK